MGLGSRLEDSQLLNDLVSVSESANDVSNMSLVQTEESVSTTISKSPLKPEELGFMNYVKNVGDWEQMVPRKNIPALSQGKVFSSS